MSLPPPFRFWPAFDPSFATDLLTAHVRAMSAHLCKKARRILGLAQGTRVQPGVVTVIQRFSSDASLNVHFHSLFTDGVFVENPDGSVTFHQLPPPTDSEIAAIAWDACRRVVRLLQRRGQWTTLPDPAKPTARPTIFGIAKMGKVTQKVRLCGAAARHEAEGVVIRDGAHAFNLWAGQGVRGGDREKLAKLIRYVLNPPFTDAQLTERPDGDLDFTFKRPHRDGTCKRVFTKMELMEKLVLQTPRPNANLIRFHCAYAPSSKLRHGAVAIPVKVDDAEPPKGANNEEDLRAWSDFRRHTHPADAMPCPLCGARLKLIELRTSTRRYRRSGIPPDDVRADIDLDLAA